MPETPSVTSDSPKTASDNDRVKASIENWKRKLLDLTKRNRALNFKVNKVSTVTVVDEQPAEVFRQLYLHENLMRFKAASEPDVQALWQIQTPPFASSQPPLVSNHYETIEDELAPLGLEEDDEKDDVADRTVQYR